MGYQNEKNQLESKNTNLATNTNDLGLKSKGKGNNTKRTKMVNKDKNTTGKDPTIFQKKPHDTFDLNINREQKPKTGLIINRKKIIPLNKEESLKKITNIKMM